MTLAAAETYNTAIDHAKYIVDRYRSYYGNHIPDVNYNKIMEKLEETKFEL